MHPKRQSHHALAELARDQHGVVSLDQLVQLGYSKESVRHAVKAGRLHPINRSVYAVGHAGLSKHGWCFAAVLSCGENALLSHRSAAWLWGMTQRWQLMVEVTAASPRRKRRTIRVHSAEALVADDRTRHGGIPTTSVARTLLDFAAVDPHFLSRALDNSHRLGLLDLIDVDALLGRSRGFRGVARLRAALEIHRPAVFTRSGLERRFLQLVRDGDLPQPSMNFFVAGYEVDAYWRAERFGVELDTYDHHGDQTAFEQDRLKQEELKLAGIEIVRITGVRMDKEPNAVIDRVRRLLAQRRRQLGISIQHSR